MDTIRFSTIAHREHVFCNPLDPEALDRLLAGLDLGPGARVLDVGCGKGEILVRLMERYGVDAVGVDTNGDFLAELRRRAARRATAGELALHEMDFAEFSYDPASFDLAMCVGATHACGGYIRTLNALIRAATPGGLVLIGDGFWRREPDAEYLAVLGAARDEYTDHDGNVAAGTARGLIPLESITSSEADWDRYEDLYASEIERFARDHPDDPDREAMLKRIRRWRGAYQRWGRSTLGFGLYLFGKPGR
jgi:ubiquinone/menaquinone biosynthesis C-methylase UbiE